MDIKRLFFIVLFFSTVLSFPELIYSSDVEVPRPTQIEVYVGADPCVRNEEKPCIDIFIEPKSTIEIYGLINKEFKTMNLPTSSEDGKVLPKYTFSTFLFPDTYIFYIKNEINGQETFFGPIKLDEYYEKIEMSFIMYNSYKPVLKEDDDREICLTQKITKYSSQHVGQTFQTSPEMDCHLLTSK